MVNDTIMTGPNDLLRHFGVDPERIPTGTRFDDLLNVLIAGTMPRFDDSEASIRVQSSILGLCIFASRSPIPHMDSPEHPWETSRAETLTFPMDADEFDRYLSSVRDWVTEAGEYMDFDNTYR